MEYVIVAIKDTAVDAFGRPFVCRTESEAHRMFADEVNNRKEGNMFAAHPKDFGLYVVGKWDDDTGEIEGRDQPPSLIVRADAVLRPIE